MGKVYRSTDKKLPADLKKLFESMKDKEIHRAIPSCVVKAFKPEEKMVVTGIANLSVADRCGEIIPPEAWDLTNFLKSPIMLLEHDRDKPIGSAFKVEKKKDGLYYEAVIGDPELAPLTYDQQKARSLLAQGILKMNSVGFIPHVIEYDEDKDVLRYTNVELLEISIVAIPMQQDSSITSVKSWRKSMETAPKATTTKAEESNDDDRNDDMIAENTRLTKEIHDMCTKTWDKVSGAAAKDDDDKKALLAEVESLKSQLAESQKKLVDTEAASTELLKSLKAQGILK